MSVLIIEDLGVERLAPIVLARLSCGLTCGGLRLVDLLEWSGADCYGVTRSHLQTIQKLDYPMLKDPRLANGKDRPKLVLSSRLVPNAATFESIRNWLSQNKSSETRWIYDSNSADAQAIGVIDPTDTYEEILAIGRNYFGQKAPEKRSVQDSTSTVAQVLKYPHDVIAQHMACFTSNLELLISKGEYRQLQDGVFVGSDVSLASPLVLDPKSGPILLERNVQVGPFSLLRGPLFLGSKCKVLEHASLKDGVCAGHTTKIGGEVEASIVEPYSNKQHHGFLGHSYVGSWVNLGAGTCTSDLKNTYGLISMDYPSGRTATDMQFLGCFIGDYSKTAINTSIFTGKWIGVCSALYGFVTSNVPSFTNYAKLFGQVATLPTSVMQSTQQRMFSRRSVAQRPCDIELLHSLFELTRSEREASAELEES
ncbi:MAG: putative sugar nucleotidyl transferase [Pirellula sp.]|jgi:UDP-N-acetylglucosamine diphosphorylase/glucosamine-1-phosphate N-acetyltransferase